MRGLVRAGWAVAAVGTGSVLAALAVVMTVGGWVTVGLGIDGSSLPMAMALIVGGVVIFLGGVLLGIVAVLVTMLLLRRAKHNDVEALR